MAPATRNRGRDSAKGKRRAGEQLEAAPSASKGARAGQTDKKQRRDDSDGHERTVAGGTKGIRQIKVDMRRRADEAARVMERQLRQDMLSNGTLSVQECLSSDMAPLALGGAAAKGAQDMSRNTTYEAALQCLHSYQALAANYESLNRSDNEVQKPAKMHWEQDRNDLTALNRSAMGAAFRILNSIVMPHAKGDVVSGGDRAGGNSDVEALAAELMAEAKTQREDATWGSVAHGYLRALSSVAELFLEEREPLNVSKS